MKRQPHRMVRHAQTIRRHFVGLALKGLRVINLRLNCITV